MKDRLVFVAFADSYECRHVVGVFESEADAKRASIEANEAISELARGPMPDVEPHRLRREGRP